jgi:hypothetical protein
MFSDSAGVSSGRKLRRFAVRVVGGGTSRAFGGAKDAGEVTLGGRTARGGSSSSAAGGRVCIAGGPNASSAPVVEMRMLICGSWLNRPGDASEIGAVAGPRMMRGAGCGMGRGDGGSAFILPIDIFFKKPHRLFFSLPARIVLAPSNTGIIRGGDVLFCAACVCETKDDDRDAFSSRSGDVWLLSHRDCVSCGRALLTAFRDGPPSIAIAAAGPTLANRFCMPGRGGVWLSRFVLDCDVA